VGLIDPTTGMDVPAGDSRGNISSPGVTIPSLQPAQKTVTPSPPLANILIIDDNPSIHAVLGYCLGGLGHEVRFAHSGEEGLRLAGERPPALIVLDVHMPVVSGLEACQRLKENAALKHVPIVMITACPTKDVLAIARANGAAEVVKKPFDIDEFLALLARYLPPEAPAAGQSVA
jgi:CheY-like chemotaxis protein